MSDERGEFLCKVMLIKALLQFLPVSDRKKIQDWLKKFSEIEEGCSEAKTRNEYACYLLINVQNGTLSQPFNKSPPSGKLKPLCRILPDFLYEDIQKQFRVSNCKLDKMLNANNDSYEMPDLKCEPSSFHCQQPRPLRGVSALLAAFSNYEGDEK